MKSISLRQFRDSIAALTEPVTVLRRDGAGNFQVLGEWHPQSGGVPAATYESGEPRVPAPVRAWPKPSQRGSK